MAGGQNIEMDSGEEEIRGKVRLADSYLWTVSVIGRTRRGKKIHIGLHEGYLNDG
jgi:hypothetical protein